MNISKIFVLQLQHSQWYQYLGVPRGISNLHSYADVIDGIDSNAYWSSAVYGHKVVFEHELSLCTFVDMSGYWSERRRLDSWKRELPHANFVASGTTDKLTKSGLILGLHTANERRRYFVTASLIGWAQA